MSLSSSPVVYLASEKRRDADVEHVKNEDCKMWDWKMQDLDSGGPNSEWIATSEYTRDTAG